MDSLRKVSDSDIQGEKLRPVTPPPVPLGIGATVRTPLTDNSRPGKKRKRENTALTTSARAAALNEISDDSDVSSDDEKSLEANPKGQLRIQKRRKHHKGQRRRVVFGEASSTTKYYSSPLTKAELRDLKGDLWFTKQDRLRSQAECLQVLKAFRVQNAEEVTRFSAVYRTSMSFPYSQESSDFLEKATVSVPLTIRGMEWGIAPKLKKRRKEHIRSVLALQDIRDAELRARFVSSRSVQSSRPARIMARIIGEGDAASAGTTSTALNVTTVPMAKKKKAEKRPLGEQQQNTKQSSSKATAAKASCGISTKKTTRLGHARRRRRPILWRK